MLDLFSKALASLTSNLPYLSCFPLIRSSAQKSRTAFHMRLGFHLAHVLVVV